MSPSWRRNVIMGSGALPQARAPEVIGRFGRNPPQTKVKLTWAGSLAVGRRLPTPLESFFHTLKTERVHHRVYATRDQARRDLFGYIEGFYNLRRLHSALGYISPADAERRTA